MDQLFAVLAEVLNTSPSELTPSTTRDHLDSWDSLAIINLAIALEGEYGISLSAAEVESLTAVKAILALLDKHGVVIAA